MVPSVIGVFAPGLRRFSRLRAAASLVVQPRAGSFQGGCPCGNFVRFPVDDLPSQIVGSNQAVGGARGSRVNLGNGSAEDQVNPPAPFHEMLCGFHPDLSGTSHVLTDLAVGTYGLRSVRLHYAPQRWPSTPAFEIHQGVRMHRVFSPRFEHVVQPPEQAGSVTGSGRRRTCAGPAAMAAQWG